MALTIKNNINNKQKMQELVFDNVNR